MRAQRSGRSGGAGSERSVSALTPVCRLLPCAERRRCRCGPKSTPGPTATSTGRTGPSPACSRRRWRPATCSSSPAFTAGSLPPEPGPQSLFVRLLSESPGPVASRPAAFPILPKMAYGSCLLEKLLFRVDPLLFRVDPSVERRPFHTIHLFSSRPKH
jgi:hypothetical protein